MRVAKSIIVSQNDSPFRYFAILHKTGMRINQNVSRNFRSFRNFCFFATQKSAVSVKTLVW
jgi:hypothetical protein